MRRRNLDTALFNTEDIHPSVHNGVFHAIPQCHHCDPKQKAEQGHLVKTQTGGHVCIRPVRTAGVQVRATCKMAEPAKILDQPSNHKGLTEKQIGECYVRERERERERDRERVDD